jgi:hypothetical protein
MIEWDGVCARAASRLCGHPACPGAGACDVNNGTPGCDDVDCCNIVCLHDSICCNERWDATCTNEAAALCTITNDPAETAISITCGEFLSGSTVGATEDVEASLCAGGVTGPGVWYRITGTGGAMAVDACNCGDGAEHTVSVLTGACPRALDCVTDSGTGPSVSWESQAGQAYFVLVQALGAGAGEFELSACCVHPDHTGDRDGDGDTDLSDLAGFMNCYAGPRGPAVAPECSFADVDQDGRIDREDFAEFLCTFNEQ